MYANPNRVVRGGAAFNVFDNTGSGLRTDSRSLSEPFGHGYGQGIRCARNP
jgi:hypothetical protein